MSRLVVAVLVFVAVFVGLGLAAVGVPAAYAVACGFVVTGAALAFGARREELKDRLPVNLMVVGVTFVGVGALLGAAGACSSDDEDEESRSSRSAYEDVAGQSPGSSR